MCKRITWLYILKKKWVSGFSSFFFNAKHCWTSFGGDDVTGWGLSRLWTLWRHRRGFPPRRQKPRPRERGDAGPTAERQRERARDHFSCRAVGPRREPPSTSAVKASAAAQWSGLDCGGRPLHYTRLRPGAGAPVARRCCEPFSCRRKAVPRLGEWCPSGCLDMSGILKDCTSP